MGKRTKRPKKISEIINFNAGWAWFASGRGKHEDVYLKKGQGQRRKITGLKPT